jgi:hypothetical protein
MLIECFKKALLLHNNACSDIAAHIVESLNNLKYEVLQLSFYNPNFMPPDFHPFGPLKEALQGQKLYGDEVKKAVQEWLTVQPKAFYCERISKL